MKSNCVPLMSWIARECRELAEKTMKIDERWGGVLNSMRDKIESKQK